MSQIRVTLKGLPPKPRRKLFEPRTAGARHTPNTMIVRYTVTTVNEDGSAQATVSEKPAGWDFANGITVHPLEGETSVPSSGLAWLMADPAGGKWRPLKIPAGTRIHFTILSCSFTIGLGAQGCDHVTAIVDHVSCGASGVAVGDEVDIYDPKYCHFNLPVELLVGLSGTATYMDASNYLAGQEYLVDCVPEVQALGCIWMIDTLCCAEEETLYPPE